jgi:hypothetical protein
MPMVCVISTPSGGCTYTNAICCGTQFVCSQGQLTTAPGSCPMDATAMNVCP